jgi:hypothetical protein
MENSVNPSEEIQDIPPSHIQQLLSELFRISLCRNDDVNLAHTGALKQLQMSQKNHGTSSASPAAQTLM